MAKGKKDKKAGKKASAKPVKAEAAARPMEFAGVDLRRAGTALKKASENPVVSELAVAALLAAAAALKESPKVRRAAAAAGEEVAGDAEAVAESASKVGTALKAAALEAARQFAVAYADGRSEATSQPKPR